MLTKKIGAFLKEIKGFCTILVPNFKKKKKYKKIIRKSDPLDENPS